MAFWKRRQQMGLAAVIIASSILLSRFMGLLRDKLISLLFGATRESDLYFTAFVIPDFINYLLAGGYFSITLIPFLSEYFAKDEEDGWRFFSTVFTWISAAIVVLTAFTLIFAPKLAALAAPGLDAEASARLAYFLRIIMPAQVFFLTGSCFTALLYLRKQFFVPAAAALCYNFFIIGGGVLLRSRGMEGFCWGVLAGSFVGNFLFPCLAARAGGLSIRPSFYHPGIKKYVLMALPLMIGQSITVLDEQFVRIFGTLAGVGAVSWLSYAHRIMMVPVSVVAQAAGVASYPFLAELLAKKDFGRFHQTVNLALRNVIVLLIPLSLWMIVIAEPTVRFIFEQGRFGPQDTLQTARLLQILLTVVCFWGYQQVLGRAYYAGQDTLSPAILGTAATVLSVPLYYVLSAKFGAPGVAAASAAAITCYSAALTFWWKRKQGGEAFSGLASGAGKVLLISLAGCVPAYLVTGIRFLDPAVFPYISAMLAIGLSGICFGVAFGFLSGRFTPELVRPFFEKAGPAGRIFLRSRPAP